MISPCWCWITMLVPSSIAASLDFRRKGIARLLDYLYINCSREFHQNLHDAVGSAAVHLRGGARSPPSPSSPC